MLANIFQLVGSIMLAYSVIVRKIDDQMKMSIIVAPIKGEVPQKLKGLLYETWQFRIGLSFIALGYAVALFNIDSKYLNALTGYTRVLIIIFCVTILLIFGLKLGRFCADKDFNDKANKYDPENPSYGTQPGELWMDNDK